MNNNKICSFFGHRYIDISTELENKVKSTILKLITIKNINTFYFGGFGEFDKLCWETTTEIKQSYPFIKRVYCLEDERYLRSNKRPKYLKTEDYEEFIYLSLSYDYWYTRIYYRNCEMIKHSDYTVFYVYNTENSGAYKALQYAVKNKKNIIRI